MSDNIIRLDLTLGYDHALGAFGEYFQALSRGQALASRCIICGRTWFPPHTHCPEDGGSCAAVDLEGLGVVVAETRTRTRLPCTHYDQNVVFIFVAMAGADNATFGRLVNFTGEVATGQTVKLSGTDEPIGHPAQIAVFIPVENN
jgi:uncharacterized OB-fold protein